MSFDVISAAYRTKLGNIPAKSVLVMLADAGGHEGTCFPSTGYIADRTEIQRRTVYRIIQVFQSLGLLSPEVIPASKRHPEMPGFRINLEMLGLDLSGDFGSLYDRARSKECPKDTDDDLKVVSQGHKTVSLGEENSVPRTQPPNPLIGVTVSEPLVNPKAPGVAAADLPAWIPTDLFRDWLEMRKKIKKPATKKAQQLAVGKLAELRADGHSAAAVLEQSILNSWQGLFPIKEQQNGKFSRPDKTEQLKDAARRALQNLEGDSGGIDGDESPARRHAQRGTIDAVRTDADVLSPGAGSRGSETTWGD